MAALSRAGRGISYDQTYAQAYLILKSPLRSTGLESIQVMISLVYEKVFNILISSEPAGCLSPLGVKPYTGTVVSCFPKVTFEFNTNSWNKNI